MGWNKLFHKSSKSSNNTNSNPSNCIPSCSGSGSGDKVSDITSPPQSLPCTPKLKKKTKLKSVFSSLSLRSSSSASKKSIITQNSIFNDVAATILNDNNIIVSDDVTKSRVEAIVEDKFITAGSIKDEDDHKLVNRIPSHESSSSPTPPPIPPPPSERAVGGGYPNLNDHHIITTTPPDLTLHSCPICARTFVPVTLAKHVRICEKTAQKKRKIFDSSRQRREGTDLALLPPKPEHMKIIQPKSVPTPIQKKKSSEQIAQQKQQQQSAQQAAPVQDRRDSLPARLENIVTQAPKVVKRSLGPVTDQCPHCERFFGMKAYDRHVEWCKEKTRISVGQNTSMTTVAKERLEARTKYRAPPLKTKRAANREKYSGFSGDDMSNNSLSEFQIAPSTKPSNSILPNNNNSSKQENKQSLQNSMTSSTTSEGQPPKNSKRQKREKKFDIPLTLASGKAQESMILEQSFSKELTSLKHNLHVAPYVSSQMKIREEKKMALQRAERKMTSFSQQKLSNIKKKVVVTLLPPKKNFNANTCRSESEVFQPPYYNDEALDMKTNTVTNQNALSDSYDPFISAKRQLEELFSPSNTSTPTTTTTNTSNKNYTQPTNSSMSRSVNLNTIKSNFKRTSSLRLPKTNISSLKTVNNLFSNKKPTIQRGISVDEGPISSSFLKSSEFDEMPVKAAFVTPIIPHRTIQMRDPNSVRGRKQHIKNLDKTENELSKTDSLAVFLKYEHELSINPLLTEKEIKDKNNSFSKRLSNISQSSSNTSNDNLNSSNKMTTSSTSAIDPKLINLCDNLPINITKMSDNDNSSASDSTIDLNFSSKMEINSLENDTSNSKDNSDTNNNNNNNNRNSTESRRLKRSLKLSKENFLFDNSCSDNTNNNDIDNNNSNSNNNNDSENNKDDEHLEQIEPISNNNDDVDKNEVNTDNTNKNSSNIKLTTDKLFDDFDLDEFISSFEDDENFPIFKDYKEFIKQTNTITKTNSNNNITFRASKENLNANNNNNSSNDVENELNKLIKQIQISNNSSTAACFYNDNNNNNIDGDVNSDLIVNHNRNGRICGNNNIIENNNEDDNDDDDEDIMNSPQSVKKLSEFTDAERELLHSVNELDRLCEESSSTNLYQHGSVGGGGGGGADSDELSSVESFLFSGIPQSGSKLSADSAYGSLSRHSPEEPILRQTRNPLQRTRQYHSNKNINNNISPTNNHNTNNNSLSSTTSNTSITLEKLPSTKLHSIPLNNNRIISSQIPSPNYHTERNLSSSESETSLPPLYTRKIELTPNPNHQLSRGDRGDSISPDCKMSKFCHECGNKFLMVTAKFCMECGVKRISLE